MQRSEKTFRVPKRKTFLKIKGLTLIEMLIVSMMLGVIALAVNSALNSGVRVWRKINQELPQEALNIFFDKFSRDLSNIIRSTDISLKGDGERLEFPTIINSLRFADKTPGEVIYIFDKGKDELAREARDYSDIYSDKQGIALPLLKNIHSLKFSYYFFEVERKKYAWVEDWESRDFPKAIRVELEINDEDRIQKFTRTVSIPIGN